MHSLTHMPPSPLPIIHAYANACTDDAQIAMTTRTTTAVTIVRAGEKINQIPAKAVAYVNHRIQPKPGVDRAGTSARDSVLEYDRRVIDDPRVKVELIEGEEWTPPSPVSSTTSRAFQLIRQAVHDVHSGAALSAPFIMTGNTDTRWYWEVADDFYRHTPIVLGKSIDSRLTCS
jgi:carboxypeptidase PM20D1